MGKDALIESAISHWAPRMVSNGVMLTDFQEVTASLEHWNDWCAAWCKRAAVHETLGLQALADNYKLTGAEHLTRAAVYYHFAKFVYVHDLDQMRAAHMKAVQCRQLALPHQKPPIRRVEIPYQGKHLAGFLRLPEGAVRPPIMIMVPGLDSAKEELEAYEIPFLQRGIATLMVDGPGQGEAEYEFPIRGDYEVAVSAMVDYVLTLTEVDSSRIGLWGSVWAAITRRGLWPLKSASRPASAWQGLTTLVTTGTKSLSSPAKPSGCALTVKRRRKHANTPATSHSKTAWPSRSAAPCFW